MPTATTMPTTLDLSALYGSLWLKSLAAALLSPEQMPYTEPVAGKNRALPVPRSEAALLGLEVEIQRLMKRHHGRMQHLQQLRNIELHFHIHTHITIFKIELDTRQGDLETAYL